MNYIKSFESYSTDYYLDFSKSEFPEKLTFSDPKCKYNMLEFTPGMNKVHILYDLDKSSVDTDNPYKGSLADHITFDFSVTYSMEEKKKTKAFIKISSGSQTWLEFSYQDGEYDRMDTTKAELSSEHKSMIEKILKKYSKMSCDSLEKNIKNI